MLIKWVFKFSSDCLKSISCGDETDHLLFGEFVGCLAGCINQAASDFTEDQVFEFLVTPSTRSQPRLSERSMVSAYNR